MRPITLMAILLAFAQNIRAEDSETLDAQSIVLTGKSAMEIFKQVDRSAPDPKEGLWEPSPREVNQLLGRLPAFLEGPPPRLKDPLSSYYRQFVGFYRDGRKLIYMNAFRMNAGLRDTWTKRAIIVYDGYLSFWGIVYDPATDTFCDFESNSWF